ncbi:hypothetical protein [Cupriavidus nantongensis]|uniref:Uncharacterized protein n=1 Tax=Cupriavidus nantongensis TaxID=1796606 RepID=A0A142JNG3_9BURK|nr:hypothetical protein [Cupriavidus nantongensis]AMR79625.1 hypothetical protein A2G96_18775 [Cupriavidus nantongensis]
MRKTEEFDLIGKTYRATQLAAFEAFSEKGGGENKTPVAALRQAQAAVLVDGRWIQLDSRAAVNAHVADPLRYFNAHVVLDALLRKIYDMNFGFLDGRKELRVPTRFLSEVPVPQAEGLPPVIATLISNGLATLKELQADYSAEDAMIQFDAYSVDALAKALNGEAAMKKAQAEARRR